MMADGFSAFVSQNGLQQLSFDVARSDGSDKWQREVLSLTAFLIEFYIHIALIAISICIVLLRLALSIRGRSFMAHNRSRPSTNNCSFRVTIFDLCTHGSRLGSVIFALVEIACLAQGKKLWAETFLLIYIFLFGILKAFISDIEWQVHLIYHIHLLSIAALLLMSISNLAPLLLLGSSYNLSTLTTCKLGFIASSVAIIWGTPQQWRPSATSHEMYHRILEDKPSSEEICSYFSYFISYSWLTGLIFHGCRRRLNLNDLPALPWFDEPLIWLDRILSARTKRSSTLWTILELLRNDMGGMAIFGAIQALFELVAPFAGFKLLQSFEHPVEIAFRPSTWVAILFLGPMIKSIASHQYIFRSTRLMVRLRIALTQELYQKMLNLSQRLTPISGDKIVVQADNLNAIEDAGIAKSQIPVGKRDESQALTLVQQDIEYIAQSRDLVLAVVGPPITFALGTSFLYFLVGWSSFVGLLIMLSSFSITALLTKRISTIQVAVMHASDDRIALVSECLQSIWTIKHLGLEGTMLSKITNTQTLEQKQRWGRALYAISINAFGDFVPLLSFYVMLLIVTFVEGKQLSASIAFTSFTVIEVIRHQLILISSVAKCIGQAWISCQRIDFYLESREVKRHDYGPPILRNATFKISPASNFCLRNLSAAFLEGRLNIVLGDSGSGKSTLLSSLLGETQLESGRVSFPRSVAYVPQNPILMNGTIRDNILFHSTYIPLRYNAVIDACGLQRDLEALESGHLQLVGEGGNALSDGQRQRIALARAVYSTRSCLLLDDVFSSVDDATIIHIWNRCFRGGFLKGRTVILTTQRPWLAKEAQLVLVMDDGIFIEKHLRATKPETNEISIPMVPTSPHLLVDANTLFAAVSPPKTDPRVDSPINHETRMSNRNSISLIFQYVLMFGGKMRAVMVFTTLFAAQVAFFATLVWLSIWINHYLHNDTVKNTFYLLIYGTILLLFIVLSTIGDVIFQYSAWKAAGTIHGRLVKSVLAASFGWLQATPHCRILNRFSKDMSDINNSLADNLRSSVLNVFRLLLRVVGIASIMPMFALPTAFLCICGLVVGEMYMRAQLSVKNIASASRSPVISHFKETISLLSVIRAHHLQEDFTNILAARLRDQARAEEAQYNLNRWVGVRIDTAAALVSLFAGIIAIQKFDSLPPGRVGFSLINVIGLSGIILSLVRKANETEVKLSSFQRVQEYTEIEPEEVTGSTSLEICTQFPDGLLLHNHTVEFRDIAAKYKPDEPDVLKNISFHIKAGERIGIVGRTGSGKSTLLLALLRALHITSGSITIGDIDIQQFPHSQLRQNISYIPQDSVLFKGSIRENIDPTGTVAEEVVAQSFELCSNIYPLSYQNLEDPGIIQQGLATRLDLETQVGRGGQNLSAGQRQIIGIARAIARKSQCKIVLIDESTAKLDRRADAKVQKILREQFEGYTFFTVAHRLNTIMDYDRIIVLADGEIQEMDTPAQLCKNKGLFYDMVQRSRAADGLVGDNDDKAEAPKLLRNKDGVLRGESSQVGAMGLVNDELVSLQVESSQGRRFFFGTDHD